TSAPKTESRSHREHGGLLATARCGTSSGRAEGGPTYEFVPRTHEKLRGSAGEARGYAAAAGVSRSTAASAPCGCRDDRQMRATTLRWRPRRPCGVEVPA